MKIYRRPFFELAKIGTAIVAQLMEAYSGIVPHSNNTVMLGTDSYRFKGGFIQSPVFGFHPELPIVSTTILSEQDGNYQLSFLNTSGSDQDVLLPNAPPNGTRFKLRNTAESTQMVNVKCQGLDVYRYGGTTIEMPPEEPPNVTDEVGVTGPTPFIVPVVSQPFTAQVLRGWIFDTDSSISDYEIVIDGLDALGAPINETLTLAHDGLTWLTVNQYSHVNTITVTNMVGEGPTDTFAMSKTMVSDYLRANLIYYSGKWYVDW